MTVSDWLKLGYAESESKELEEASKYGDLMADTDAESASKKLAECMKIYHFKNGSSVESIESNGEVVRGRGADISLLYNDCDICHNKEIVDKVLEPFCNDGLSNTIAYLRKHPSEYIYLTSGKRLPLWQRIWLDKICPLIRRWFKYIV